jgi:hypothetical protein
LRKAPRTIRRLSFVSCLVAVLLTPLAARAQDMDLTPERLVIQPPGLMGMDTCQSVAANPQSVLKAPYSASATPSQFSCAPANVAWKNLISELGFAIAPTAFHPARTTGFGGFALTLEASYTHINADAVSTEHDSNGTKIQYWHLGTQGPVDPNTHQYSIVNNGPDSILQVYTIKARKGLPFGFEITGALGYLANTTTWTIGADIRWALLEGFRTGFLGYVPDISIGGGTRTLTGSSKFDLTTVGMDVQVSKPFALADSAVLTPYVGYQFLWIFGDSGILDLTPNVDALQQCGLVGRDNMGNPICRNTLQTQGGGTIPNSGDFNNDATFARVRENRHRGIVGLNYRYSMLYLAGQFLMDLVPASSLDPDLSSTRQWTLSLEAGVYF